MLPRCVGSRLEYQIHHRHAKDHHHGTCASQVHSCDSIVERMTIA